MNKLRLLILILLLSIILILQIPVAYLSPALETKSPSEYYSIVAGWNQPQEAFSSDNDRASTGRTDDDAIMGYHGYGFDIPPNATIETVEAGVEGYVTETGDVLYWAVSWDNGNSWSEWYFWFSLDTEQLEWHDFTGATAWTPAKLNNDMIHTKLKGHVVPTGCYHPDSEVSLWEDLNEHEKYEMKVEKIRDVKKGDKLLSFDMETGHYIPNVILEDAEITPGNFTYYRIIAEYPMSLWDKEIYPWENETELGHKDLCVTGNQSIYTLERGKIPAREVKVGMHFHGLFRKDGVLSIVPIPIVSVEIFQDFGAVTLQGTREIIFSHYLLSKTSKSCYVDWIPVRVIYSTGQEYEEMDCQWIGVNNTYADFPTKFSCNWEDLYDMEGLSHYRFSTNNTGPWVNDTWSDSWRDTVWADAEKTLNSTPEITVAFRFYVNSSLGNNYSSTICFLRTSLYVNQSIPSQGPFFHSYQIDYGAAIILRAPDRVEPSLSQYLANTVPISLEIQLLNRMSRTRNLGLLYNVSGPEGELILNGSLEEDLDPNSQEELTLAWRVPLGKKEAPKNYTLSLQVLSRNRILGDPVSHVITVAQSSWAPLYVLALLGAVCVVGGIGYGGYKLIRRKS